MKEYLSDFEVNGFAIVNLDYQIINKVRTELNSIINDMIKSTEPIDSSLFLDNLHLRKINNLNSLRLSTIVEFNKIDEVAEKLYESTRGVIDEIIGVNLAVQKKINLSFQLPDDSSSLLPIHSDVWAGNSPFEVVLWIPFVDVYKSKSMYLLPLEHSLKYHDQNQMKHVKLGDIFKAEEDKFIWPEVKFGQALIFSHSLLHGNIVNSEKTSRVSLNMRFKTLTSPYGSKSLGDYFRPFRMTPGTKIGWDIYGRQ